MCFSHTACSSSLKSWELNTVNFTYKVKKLLLVHPQFKASKCECVGYYLQFYCSVYLLWKLNSQVNSEKKKKKDKKIYSSNYCQ